jgi:hypothetical protein
MRDAEEKYVEWIQKNNTGCRFAAHLAKHREEAKWMGMVVDEGRFGCEQVEKINVWLQKVTGELGAEAADVIFPGITGVAGVTELILQLCGSKQWGCRELEPSEGIDDSVSIGLRWYLPGQRWMSWVLGFADLSTMPFTRRAPVTAISLRTAPPGPAPRWAYELGAESKSDSRDLTATVCPVHLADMQTFEDERKVAEWWSATKKSVKRKIGAGPSSKAALTFSLPGTERVKLMKFLILGLPDA